MITLQRALPCFLLVFATLSAAEAVKKGSDTAPLGSADFLPSAEHPVGWRGDGSGCYPGAKPPTVWYQKANGESKNILWKTKLFCYSWSTPIVVGDKIFTFSDPYDLVCLDKNTGKIGWIRSFPPFIGVSDEEKKANPAFKHYRTEIVIEDFAFGPHTSKGAAVLPTGGKETEPEPAPEEIPF